LRPKVFLFYNRTGPVVALKINKDGGAVRLWPNPGKGIFHIQLTTAPASIKVYSNDGRLVMNGSINSRDYQLNMSDKPAGLYFVRVTFADGTDKRITISKE